ncbi:MAG: glycosyltransferase family 39 protein [Candidatus Acidiferrales bacterium]
MANLVPAEQLAASAEIRESNSRRSEPEDSSHSPTDSAGPWSLTAVAAPLLLVALWVVKLYTTWGAWGNLTIDSGHEMYVPAMLAQGKVLYRDLWFPFGPAAPYFTSYLYRLFGVNLNVLYWAGALSALGTAIFLYLTGRRLSSQVIGWTAGAVVLLEAFQPSIFCFPLPYSSAAVYGCFVGALFLWLIAQACYSESRVWVLAAGTASAIALLLKPEFGIACYGTLACLIAVRWLFQRSPSQLAGDVAATLPGIAICGLVIRWMVSIAGAEFITQENVQSWPTSYFLKTYGKTWLAHTGFTVSGSDFLAAARRSVPVAGVLLAAAVLLRWKRFDTRSILARILILFSLALYFIQQNYFVLPLKQDMTLILTKFFFPQDMVLYILMAAAGAWCYFCWRPAQALILAFPLLFTFSGLLAFRVLMKMNSIGYPVLYNGPVVLSFLLLLGLLIPRSGRSHRFIFLAELGL